MVGANPDAGRARIAPGFGIAQVLADGLGGRSGFVRAHDGDLADEYPELLQQRDASGLSKRDFSLAAIAPRLEPGTMSSGVAEGDV